MAAPLEDRLTELEVRLSFVDDTLATMNDLVAAHDRQLLALRGAIDQLRQDLVSVRGALSHDPQDEPPPPHY